MAECGHFRTHWTVVYDEHGAWSIRYCTTCREQLILLPGASPAEQMQHKADVARIEAPTDA